MADRLPYPRILPVGDAALSVEFGDRIDPAINRRVYSLDQALRQAGIPCLVDLIPSYRSLLICFDPLSGDMNDLCDQVKNLLDSSPELANDNPRRFEIPVQYGGQEGPDLPFVAEYCRLTPLQVVELHCAPLYRVYMMGFTPGFPYLGGLDERIAAPRLASPREQVPAGSVGIAANQTGIYPITSPGGWQIIGRTSLVLFDPMSREPFILSPGDTLRFIPRGLAGKAL